MQKTIAISTDYNYVDPTETLIKSIAYHNDDVAIYVINQDIPQEWFINLNNRLRPLRITVHDIKLDPALLQDEVITTDYLSKMAYGRILIPRLIHADRVLYLDGDIIINDNLDELFNYDLQGFPIGAIKDYFLGDSFNSGVLLIDNKKLRESNFVDEMLEKGKQATFDNDQTILNERFKNNYLSLPGKFNVQIGGDFVTFNHPDQLDMYRERLQQSEPYTVIHYTTSSKPWMTTNTLQLRDLWWQYHCLDYTDVVMRNPLPSLSVPDKRGNLFCFTNAQEMHGICELAAALPNYEFHVAAYSMFGPKLIEALSYPNIKLHPIMTEITFEKMLNSASAYLDINYYSKNVDIIRKFIDKGDQILSFNDTVTNELRDNPQYHIFNDVQSMINQIEQLPDSQQ